MNPMADEDTQLMCRCRAGDSAAFAQLFERWRRPMVRFATRFVGNQARGEELAQDIFMKVYRARTRYEPRERFRAFLFRVATNHCLNEVRRPEYRRPATSLDSLVIEPIDRRRPAPEALVHAARMQASVRAAVLELPPNQRAALLLQREQGLGLAEIAQALDTTVGAVKSLLNRARKTLMTSLKPLLNATHEEAG